MNASVKILGRTDRAMVSERTGIPTIDERSSRIGSNRDIDMESSYKTFLECIEKVPLMLETRARAEDSEMKGTKNITHE